MEVLEARLRALTSALGVLALGMVLLGVVLPNGDDDGYTSLDPAAPVRLSVPSLDIRAPVNAIEVGDDRVLDPPADVLDVGWWDASALPGQATGSTVIAGHTVNTGGGSLDRLADVRRGAVVDVLTRNGVMRYEVRRTKIYDKEQLARNAVRVFGQDAGDGRLVLVSCADWDGTAYDSNVVVYADPVGSPTQDA